MRSAAAAVFIVLLMKIEMNGQTLSLGCSRPENRKQQISSSKSKYFVPINKKTLLNWNIVNGI
jgi:hypothetical protein